MVVWIPRPVERLPLFLGYFFLLVPIVLAHNYCSVNSPAPSPKFDKYSTPELIEAQGFPAESHEVITSDGYILTLHRVRNEGRAPVFLLHGIMSSSRDWFMQRGNNSLAFQLHMAGYDVWMGNMRGNLYSQQHLNLSVEQPEYWDFAFDQIAQRDVPAFTNYITEVTGSSSFHCIGFSMGTRALIAALTRDALRDKCRTFIGMAPIVDSYFSTSVSAKFPARFARPEQPLKDYLYGLDPTGRLPPRQVSSFLKRAEPWCAIDFLGICSHSTYLLLGPPHLTQVDWRMQRRIFNSFPSPTSIRTFIQVSHPIRDKTPFMEYLYQTPEENCEHYGSFQPPIYNLSQIRAPMWLIVGRRDRAAPLRDVRFWMPKVGSLSKKIIVVSNRWWTHLDFVWGKHACKLVYTPIVTMLRDYDASS